MQCSTGSSNRALQHTVITLAHTLFLAAMLHCCLIIIIPREVHYGSIDSHFLQSTPLHFTYQHTHWMFRTAQCNILEKDIMLWRGTYIHQIFLPSQPSWMWQFDWNCEPRNKEFPCNHRFNPQVHSLCAQTRLGHAITKQRRNQYGQYGTLLQCAKP